MGRWPYLGATISFLSQVLRLFSCFSTTYNVCAFVVFRNQTLKIILNFCLYHRTSTDKFSFAPNLSCPVGRSVAISVALEYDQPLQIRALFCHIHSFSTAVGMGLFSFSWVDDHRFLGLLILNAPTCNNLVSRPRGFADPSCKFPLVIGLAPGIWLIRKLSIFAYIFNLVRS